MIYMPKVRMEIFSLILWILSYREKIYYWHIEISKANAGSKTAGTDSTIIKDIGKLPAETVVKK